MWGSIKIDWHPFSCYLRRIESSEDPRGLRVSTGGFQSEPVTRLSERSMGLWSSSHERDLLKPSKAELGLGPRPIVRASPQRLGKSLRSSRAERWVCDTAAFSCQPDQPDECRTRPSRTHVSDLPRRVIAALPCGVCNHCCISTPRAKHRKKRNLLI